MGDLVASFGLLCCGGLLLLIFSGGGVFAIYQSRKSLKQADLSQGWPAVTGEILEAQVTAHPGTDAEGETDEAYLPVVKYRYPALGQTFIGNRRSFGFTKTHRSRQAAENELARYPQGSQVTVFYNPADPSQAVLERKAGASTLALILGIGFILFGFCLACPLIFSGLAAALNLLKGS